MAEPLRCERCNKTVPTGGRKPVLCNGKRGYRLYLICKACEAIVQAEKDKKAMKVHYEKGA